MRRYAQGTKVGTSRSRGQIDSLLRNFGASGVQWTDEWVPNRIATICFVWKFKETDLMARIRLVCDRKAIGSNAIDQRTGRVSENKLERLLTSWDAEAHRLLLLFLKGAFFAIDAGLISAEQIFFPFFVDRNGSTVWEVVGKRLTELPNMGAGKLLLTDGKDG